MVDPERGGHARAPVAALRAEPLVAKLPHQPHPEGGDGLGVHAALTGVVGEAVAGQRRRDDVEGVGGVAAVARGVRQWPNDLVHLEEGAGPAVGDHQRHGVGTLALDVDEVDAETVDVGLELRKLVEHPLVGAPVVDVAPVLAQLLDISEVRAVVPARSRNLVGPARLFEAALQVGQVLIGDVDGERRDRHGSLLQAGVVDVRSRRLAPDRLEHAGMLERRPVAAADVEVVRAGNLRRPAGEP